MIIFSSTDKKFNFNESKEQSSLRIQEICNLYSRSDVKTGLYLSSGLDSTFLKEILEKKANLDSISHLVIFQNILMKPSTYP